MRRGSIARASQRQGEKGRWDRREAGRNGLAGLLRIACRCHGLTHSSMQIQELKNCFISKTRGRHLEAVTPRAPILAEGRDGGRRSCVHRELLEGENATAARAKQLQPCISGIPLELGFRRTNYCMRSFHSEFPSRWRNRSACRISASTRAGLWCWEAFHWTQQISDHPIGRSSQANELALPHPN